MPSFNKMKTHYSHGIKLSLVMIKWPIWLTVMLWRTGIISNIPWKVSQLSKTNPEPKSPVSTAKIDHLAFFNVFWLFFFMVLDSFGPPLTSVQSEVMLVSHQRCSKFYPTQNTKSVKPQIVKFLPLIFWLFSALEKALKLLIFSGNTTFPSRWTLSNTKLTRNQA